MLRAATLALLFAVSVAAQGPPAPPQSAAPPPAQAAAPPPSLSGAVTGAGLALPGATITARCGATRASTVTHADGAFAIAKLPAGACSVEVAMTGFVTQRVEVTIPPAAPLRLALTLAPLAATHAAPVAVPAPPPATVAGAAPGAAPPQALAINGSVDNGAASPYAMSPAFGNNRPKLRSLFNGGFGLQWGSSALDARSFSLSGQPSPQPTYNNLTGLFQFGGPLLIPHVTNANSAPFFFVAYQKSTRLNATTTSALVPTLAQRAAVSSPQAAALLAYYPDPNLPAGAGAYNYQTTLANRQHQDQLQSRFSKYLNSGNSFSGQLSLSSTRSGGANLFGFLDDTSTLGWNAQVSWRHSFTRTLYATVEYDYSREATQVSPYFAGRTDVAAAAGIAGPDSDPRDWGPPTLTFSDGIAALTDGLPAHNRNQTGAISTSAYWNHNAHNITFGGDYRRLEFNYFQQQNPRGSFTFNGAATGDAFTDFLDGLADAASLSFGNADKYFRETTNDLYFTDDWRTTDALTLDLGARYEYSGPTSERYGRLVNLATGANFTSAAPVLGAPPRADYAGLEPRLGLAWRPFLAGSLLVRAGYGIYRDSSLYQAVALAMAEQAPLATSLNIASTPASPLTLATALTSPPGATPDVFAIDPNFRVGYAQDWKASLQQDLPDGMVMTLSYLGTKGTRGVQRFYPNSYAPGAVNPCPACPAGYLYETSGGNSTDESGTAMLQRRFHNGLAFTAAYTYAHAIDDAALGGGSGATAAVVAQNWRDLDAERGRSDFDQRHKFTLTTQYSSGAGRGGWLMRAWRRPLFGGWTLTTNLTAGSGLPLTPTLLAIIPGTGFTGLRPDATGASPAAAPAGLYVNPAAFAAPAPGAWGDAGRNSIEGPSQFALNASLQREFPLPYRLDSTLRVDATNVLNHVAFTSYNVLIGSALFGLPANASAMRSLETTYRITF